jgi:hypothetical protein
MNVIKTKKGYFYSIENGKNKRISRQDYLKQMKLKQKKLKQKKLKIQMGGNPSFDYSNNNQSTEYSQYVQKWSDIFHFDLDSLTPSLVAFRWGNERVDDTQFQLSNCDGIKHFEGFNGRIYSDSLSKLSKLDQWKAYYAIINEINEQFIQSDKSLNVRKDISINKMISNEYYKPLLKNLSNRGELRNTENLFHPLLQGMDIGDAQQADHTNPLALFSITLAMIGMMTTFLKTGKDYLLWFQNKADVVDYTVLTTIVSHFMTDNVDGAYLFYGNKSRRKNNNFNGIANSLIQTFNGIKYCNLKDTSNLINPMNTCVLLKRNLVIGFLKHWKLSPLLVDEDGQLFRYLKEIDAKVCMVIPNKTPRTTGNIQHLTGPLINYNYGLASSY